MKPRILEIRRGVLEKNDRLAASLRDRFQQADVLTLPDSGHNPHFEARAGFVEATLA